MLLPYRWFYLPLVLLQSRRPLQNQSRRLDTSIVLAKHSIEDLIQGSLR